MREDQVGAFYFKGPIFIRKSIYLHCDQKKLYFDQLSRYVKEISHSGKNNENLKKLSK